MGLVVLIVGISLLTRTDWQPLYNNLSAQAAGQITTELTSMKIPYQLTDQGRTVEVPAAEVDQVRVDLASDNIPSTGTVGLPSPVSFSLGETDQEIQINQLIDTEAMLESTIDSISGIKSSKVLINQPSPSLFGEGASQASASVFVDLNSGATLNAGQVRGIMNLVAHAVSGLSLQQVSVVDQYGTVLSAGALNTTPSSSAAGQASQELAAEQDVDNQIETEVSSLLTQVLGPGNAVVRVNTTLNFNNREVRQVLYGKGALASQSLNTSSSKSASTAVTGAGSTSNTPTYPSTTSGPSTSSSRDVTNHYDVTQTVSDETIPAGGIEHMSVAVAVDQGMSAAKVQALKNLVVQAAGVNLKAGDQVDILAEPFNHALVKQALASIAATQKANRLHQQIEAAMAFLALVLVIVGIRRMLKNQAQRRTELMESRELYLAAGGAPMRVADYLPDPRPELAEPTVYEQARTHLTATARDNPETVARLIRTWLAEDE